MNSQHSHNGNTVEPPGATNINIHQHKDSNLFRFECDLTSRISTLVMSAITMESLRRSRLGGNLFTPNTISIQPDSATGLNHVLCELDLDYILIVMSTIKKSERHSTKSFDVFISYASQDLEYVQNLVAHLEDLGIRVWFDKKQIQWGDQFQDKIDEGILQSRFFLPVISTHYIDKHKMWTRTELYAASQAKRIHNHQILPLLLDISDDEFVQFSSTSATQTYMDAAQSTPTQIAVALLHMLQDESDYAA